jgi:hypothetical protein
MLYFDNWCTLTYHTRQIDINVHLSRDDIIRTTNTKLELLKKNAVKNALSYVGNNPVICLSGGIDSQTVLSIFNECNSPFTAVTFDFGNNLNAEELANAQSFADLYKIPLTVIKLNIMRFLLRDLDDFSSAYRIISPQFAVHAYFLETIKSMGYTGAILGGNGFTIENQFMKFNLSDAQLLDIENYSCVSGFNVIPSFLSFDKDLCIALAMKTPSIEFDKDLKLVFDPVDKVLKLSKILSNKDRYELKIQSYQNLNCKIKPQSIKKTGFEEIKQFYNTQHNSDWAFETAFRFPLRTRIPECVVKTVIDSVLEQFIVNCR